MIILTQPIVYQCDLEVKIRVCLTHDDTGGHNPAVLLSTTSQSVHAAGPICSPILQPFFDKERASKFTLLLRSLPVP